MARSPATCVGICTPKFPFSRPFFDTQCLWSSHTCCIPRRRIKSNSMILSVAILVLGYIGIAAAQTQLLPPCAQGCVGNDFGGCQTLDVACICGNKPLIAGLACCVSLRCNLEEQNNVIDFANKLCKPRGVNDLPTTATCPSSTASVTVSSTSSVVVSSTAPPTTAAPTGAAGTGNATTPGTPTTPGATGASPSPTAGAMPICQGSYAGVGLSFALAGLLAL
ncbi:hypothetical protein HDK77DRAFT_21427 [Phyllosticta capitalensis]